MSFVSHRVPKISTSAYLEAKHVLLRGLPTTFTSQDVRRLVMQRDMKGVTDVSLYYKHCRPTGKAILTMSLPDYTRAAVREARDIVLPGCKIEAEAILDPRGLGVDLDGEKLPEVSHGTGPSAGVPEGKTVTLSGFRGKTSPVQVALLLKYFRTARDQPHPIEPIPLPEKKFSLFSRFLVYLESESEAQRFVRKYHMTRYKNIPDGPVLKASVIY